MARHRFGDGRYRYFDHPLPEPIPALREGSTAAGADRQRVGGAAAARRTLSRSSTRAARALPRRRPGAPDAPDPPLRRRRLERAAPGPLRRGLLPLPGADRPLEPGVDFEGGEFVLVEQRPRAQSRAHVIEPAQGAFVIFPTHHRPNPGNRLPPGRPPPRGEHHRERLAHGARGHLPRREVSWDPLSRAPDPGAVRIPSSPASSAATRTSPSARPGRVETREAANAQDRGDRGPRRRLDGRGRALPLLHRRPVRAAGPRSPRGNGRPACRSIWSPSTARALLGVPAGELSGPAVGPGGPARAPADRVAERLHGAAGPRRSEFRDPRRDAPARSSRGRARSLPTRTR